MVVGAGFDDHFVAHFRLELFLECSGYSQPDLGTYRVRNALKNHLPKLLGMRKLIFNLPSTNAATYNTEMLILWSTDIFLATGCG